MKLIVTYFLMRFHVLPYVLEVKRFAFDVGEGDSTSRDCVGGATATSTSAKAGRLEKDAMKENTTAAIVD